MHIILQRIISSAKGTYGVLLVDGKVFCTTLELPWNNNQSNISCIPIGTYKAVKMFSEHFQKIVFVLQDVPGRDLIEFHIGNTIKDTHGCVLLGKSYEQDSIVGSRTAFGEFMAAMPEEGFTITVNDVAVKEETSWV